MTSDSIAKKAFVPLTPAAMQGQPPMDPAMMGGQPPMDPAAAQGGGMPMPPADPAMMGGEQIDPETGLVIVDPAQGIVMDPNTGIMLNKQTGEFMSPEGQPIPPEQAIQMIEAAAAQLGGQGSAPVEQGQPPMDPAMMGGQPPMDPAAMMAAGGQPPMDPAMMGEALPPAPQEALTGMGAPAGAVEGDIETMMPGFEDFVAKSEQNANNQDKFNKKMIKELVGARADMQSVRRELEQVEDNQDVLLARLTDVVDRFERAMGVQANAQTL